MSNGYPPGCTQAHVDAAAGYGPDDDQPEDEEPDMRYDTETLRAIVEYIDPDWSAHFAELEHAATTYQLRGGAVWDEAVYCVVGDRGEPNFSDDPLEIHGQDLK